MLKWDSVDRTPKIRKQKLMGKNINVLKLTVPWIRLETKNRLC